MPTIKEVAQRAGVGVGTVSRVLNNAAAVHPETRARVQRAIVDLDYHPNYAARQLVTARTLTLAVVLPFLTRPFFVNVLQGIEASTTAANYHLNIFNVETAASRDYYFDELPFRGRVDGLIVVTLPLGDQEIERLHSLGLPTVMVDGFNPQLPSVSMNNCGGALAAVNYLIEKGHRRIGFLSGPLTEELGFVVNRQRLSGYHAALRQHEIPIDHALEREAPDSIAGGEAMTHMLLDHATPPTAIFATSDVHALGALRAARSRNLAVPDQLAIMGYDDIELAEYVGLSTVRQPMAAIGRRGVELLLDEIMAPSSAPLHETLEPTIVPRQTA